MPVVLRLKSKIPLLPQDPHAIFHAPPHPPARAPGLEAGAAWRCHGSFEELHAVARRAQLCCEHDFTADSEHGVAHFASVQDKRHCASAPINLHLYLEWRTAALAPFPPLLLHTFALPALPPFPSWLGGIAMLGS